MKHKNLVGTIATPGDLLGPQRVMACHHSDGDDKMYCIGWLNHQLGVGNNIGMRMRMLDCENINEMKVYGKQHERFEDTLPKEEDEAQRDAFRNSDPNRNYNFRRD